MPIIYHTTAQRAVIPPIILLSAAAALTFYYSSYSTIDNDAVTMETSEKSTSTISEVAISIDVPKNVTEDKRKVIFMGSSFFGSPFQFSDLPQACRISHDLVDLPKADAVILHALDQPLPGLNNEKRTNPDQVYVGVMYESAKIYPFVSGPFNWTMTFRSDSDVYSPYCGRFEIATKGNSVEDLEPRLKYLRKFRKKKVAWMVSNCQDDNFRLSYALELSKYIQTDIYGSCSPNGLICNRFGPNATQNCWEMLASNYKFYLSFESSNCKDYITEKFYMPMYYSILPIVYGGSSVDDYSNLAPPHSYIDTRNYKSPKELANYLLELDESPHLYEEYFAWRRHFTLDYSRSFVGQDILCGKLWNLEKYRKPGSNEEFQKWWHEGSKCVAPHYHPPGSWLLLMLELIAVGIAISLFGYLCRAYLKKSGLENSFLNIANF